MESVTPKAAWILLITSLKAEQQSQKNNERYIKALKNDLNIFKQLFLLVSLHASHVEPRESMPSVSAVSMDLKISGRIDLLDYHGFVTLQNGWDLPETQAEEQVFILICNLPKRT